MRKKEITTTAEDVQEKIEELTKKKKEDLEAAQNNLAEAESNLAQVEEKLKEASANMDLDAYQSLQDEKKRYEQAIEMYRGRQEQLANQEIISEQDSDEVIDSLINYELETTQNFLAEVFSRVPELREITDRYTRNIGETEQTILRWCNEVHANYRTFGRTTRRDPVTGTMTDRSPHPVPVRITPYAGCAEAALLSACLQKLSSCQSEYETEYKLFAEA